MKTIRWGIIGAGGIAERFAEACKNVEGASLAAIASRSIEKANAFADRFGIEHRFGSYEEMAQWDGIDAAYVATPHATHGPFAILFMNVLTPLIDKLTVPSFFGHRKPARAGKEA